MKQQIDWDRMLRRSFAFFSATIGLWLLLMSAGTGTLTRLAKNLAGHEAFAEAALRVELGSPEQEKLPFRARLAIMQSPLLAANPPDSVSQTELPLSGPASDVLPPVPVPLPDAQPVPDHDDLVSTTPPPENGPIVERTLVPSSPKGYLVGNGLYLYDRSGMSPTPELERISQKPLTWTMSPTDQGPQVLIIHTHSTEAYAQTPEDPYTPTDANCRTLDQLHSVIRVGDEVQRVLTEMGLSVLHDKGIYDYPHYNGSYGRSRKAVVSYLQQYPTIRLVLDLHRDALAAEDGTVYKAVTTIDGVKTAQVMLVIGSNGANSGHVNWEDNLALACRIQKSLDTLYPTLARPMTLRKSSYNQELSPGSLLVEVGCHGNTLEEALAGARLFARAAGACLVSLR